MNLVGSERHLPRMIVVFGLGAVSVLCSASSSPALGASISLRQKWTNFFAETEQSLAVEIRSPKAFKGRLTWRYQANQRTIERGEADVEAVAERPAETTIKLRLPPVRDGVVFRTDLTLSLFTDAGEPVAQRAVPLWLFPRSPFTDRRNWLKEADISLFDPVGDTERRFDKEDVPYTWLRNVAALEGVDSGLVVVGEGISLEDYPDLGAALASRAAAGLGVLCLPFKDGQMPLAEIAGANSSAVNWRREQVISQLDKRLDAQAWPPENEVPVRGLRPLADGDRIVLEVSTAEHAWPWVEAEFPKRDGHLLLCGFPLIDEWDRGPTPRFLLSAVLTHLTQRRTAKNSTSEE